jgi:selenide,water dikinase
MIPGWMAGHYSAREALIDLRPLSQKAGIKLVADMVCGLDADRKTVRLSNGRTVAYDLLSLASGEKLTPLI